MRLSVYAIPITAALLGVLTACETTIADAQYQRCWPTLTSDPAPATGAEGDTVTLTGRHLLSYLSGPYDPSIELAVTFDARRAVVLSADGPYDVEGHEGACEACASCVESEGEGCLGCEQECEACLTDVKVVAPQGDGTAQVSLYNGMGESNSVSFTYAEGAAETPTASPAPTASPTAAAGPTPTADDGTPVATAAP